LKHEAAAPLHETTASEHQERKGLQMFKPDNITNPIPFKADVTDAVALQEGDEAADRVLSRADLIDHLKIGRALMVGSRIAAAEAGSDRGKQYNIAFSRWLQQHPKLLAVNASNRAAALWCLDPDNWPRVEKYLATLDIEERQTITLRTVRRRLDLPRPAADPSPRPAPTAAPTDRVREAADQAEIATLRAEIATLREKTAAAPAAPSSPKERLRRWREALADAGLDMMEDDGSDKAMAGLPPFVIAVDRERFDAWVADERKDFEDSEDVMLYPDYDALERYFQSFRNVVSNMGLGWEEWGGRSALHITDHEWATQWFEHALAYHAESERLRLVGGAKEEFKRVHDDFYARYATPPVTPDPAPEPPQEEGPSARAIQD
jgi:hypothetical protein